MSNFKVTGTITKIGEKKTLDSGAVVLDYIVTNNSMYPTQYNLGMYKKPEYAEHVDNFIKFNKVGDQVEVEFTIRSTEYNGKIYNNLNHWKCDKISEGTIAQQPTEPQPADDLPF